MKKNAQKLQRLYARASIDRRKKETEKYVLKLEKYLSSKKYFHFNLMFLAFLNIRYYELYKRATLEMYLRKECAKNTIL